MLTLSVRGSNYEMGYQHGLLLRDDIHDVARLRLGSCQEPFWTGKELPFEDIITLADACIPFHREYAPNLLDEWKGIADTSERLLSEILIINGFTDFADVIYNSATDAPRMFAPECTTFMVSPEYTTTGTPYIGQNWDLHRLLTPFVLMLKGYPDSAPAFMALTLTGCIGMAGINEHGIAVCINNLADCAGRPGVMWNMVVRKILEMDNLESALDAILHAPIAGAHNYLIMDATGTGYNVEATTNATHVTPLSGTYAHTNHCLHQQTRDFEQQLSDQEQLDSATRLRRANALLANGKQSLESLTELTRNRDDHTYSICTISTSEWDVETCGSIIMSPSTRELWALQGLPTEQQYERFTL